MTWQCFPNSVKGQEGKSPQWGGFVGGFYIGWWKSNAGIHPSSFTNVRF